MMCLLSLWLLFFLTSETSLSANTTLLFDSDVPGYNLRNCSCSTPVQDCDEALANSLCRCHTVLHSSLPPARLTEPGPLTVWVKELWVLEELLNRSKVVHLQLSFCGKKTMYSQYLALLSLQTLKIHTAAPEARYPNQEITVSPAAVFAGELDTFSSFDYSSSLHVTILDIAVLNGLSALRAYSVVGPPAATLFQHFPHLALVSALPDDPTDPSEKAKEPVQNLFITFVY
uniref:Uncharacterized protein n=1 Tax=Mastacembelus armatus TaxID=205130 RepID=A0A3Q3LMC6_9TELE